MHLRIPWVASTSLIWTCILSAMRGDAEQVELSAEDAMDLAGGGQGKGIELLDFVTGTISEKPSYLYDATKAHILVTATGENARARRRPRPRVAARARTKRRRPPRSARRPSCATARPRHTHRRPCLSRAGRDRIGFIADLVGCSEKANVLDAKMYKVTAGWQGSGVAG